MNPAPEGTIRYSFLTLKRTNDRLEEAEMRIEQTEIALQATSTLIKWLTQRQAKQEASLIDQEGYVRRDNLRTICKQSHGL